MKYLYGDSTESDLEFDYLAFLREVIDCAVVMVECEVTLGVTVEDRRARELETVTVVAAVEDLGKRASQVVGPVVGDQPTTAVGRCAAAIATAIREAVEREAVQSRATLAAECDEMDRQDQRQRGRARTVLEKLLRTHDLPGAEKSLEVAWTASGVKATMRQRTGFGVEAVLSLEIPVGSVLGIDLRVEKIAEGVELHAHETAGWLKKSDKVVPHKLGRYQVASVTVASDTTTVRLRVAPEPGAAGFTVTWRRTGELSVEPTGGGPGREVAIDDRNRPALRLLVERLEAAVRALGDNRTGLVSVDIDGVPITQHEHPRVLAERMVAAVAPAVLRIAQRSRSPGELVLRRMIGDNRREEIFVSTADLSKRLDGLPLHAREVFGPLQLGGEPARSPGEPRAPARPTAEPRPAAAERTLDHRFDTEPEGRPEPRPDARPEARPDPRPEPHPLRGRTVPPPAPMPEGRTGPSRLPSHASIPEPRRTGPAPRVEPAVVVDATMFEDKSPPFAIPRVDASTLAARPPTAAARSADRPAEASHDAAAKRTDDMSLGAAIDRALDETDGKPE
ncbi:MAG TPA: hypothetical protein VHW23_24880 [Kofleriaceae bacterium]|nr:hypothetical protein [Kofleriaceae bacterium]